MVHLNESEKQAMHHVFISSSSNNIQAKNCVMMILMCGVFLLCVNKWN